MKTFLTLFILLSVVAIAVGCVLIPPPNMDEFVHYTILSCNLFPRATEHVFLDACGYYDLQLLNGRVGPFLPLRSYAYVGFSSSLLYWPFYKLWPHFMSARLLGVFGLAGFSFLLRRMTSASWLLCLVLSFGFFPLAFQNIVDTGPLALQCFGILALVYFLPRLKNYFHAFIYGGFLFLCIEHKPVFLTIAPSLVLFSAVWLMAQNQNRASFFRTFKFALVSGVVTAMLCFLLFYTKTRGNGIYGGDLFRHPRFALTDWHAQLDMFLQKLWPYFYNFGNFAHRIYGDAKVINFPTLLFWFCTLVILLFSLLPSRIKSGRKSLLLSSSALFCFIGAVFTITRSTEVWAAHHLTLALPFLVLSLAFAFTRLQKLQMPLLFLITLSQVAIATDVLWLKKPMPHDDASKIKILKITSSSEFEKNYITACIDWGYYYIASLYGPQSQVVLFLDITTPDHPIERVQAIAEKYGKSAAFVVQKGSLDGLMPFLKKTIPTIHLLEHAGNSPEQIWQIWVP